MLVIDRHLALEVRVGAGAFFFGVGWVLEGGGVGWVLEGGGVDRGGREGRNQKGVAAAVQHCCLPAQEN